MISLFKWIFAFPGIQYSTRQPFQVKFFGKKLFWFSRHAGVGYLPNGPGPLEIQLFAMEVQVWHRTFHEYTCKFCGTHVWSYRPATICESFTCFCKNGAKWA